MGDNVADETVKGYNLGITIYSRMTISLQFGSEARKSSQFIGLIKANMTYNETLSIDPKHKSECTSFRILQTRLGLIGERINVICPTTYPSYGLCTNCSILKLTCYSGTNATRAT